MANLPNAQGDPFFGQKRPKFAFSGRRGIFGWYMSMLVGVSRRRKRKPIPSSGTRFMAILPAVHARERVPTAHAFWPNFAFVQAT